MDAFCHASVIWTFQFSEYPPVPMCSDKWPPTVLSPCSGSFRTGKAVWTPNWCLVDECADYCMLINEWEWVKSHVCLFWLKVHLGSVLDTNSLFLITNALTCIQFTFTLPSAKFQQLEHFNSSPLAHPHTHTHTSFPRLSPHPEENANGGRAWYRFAHDIGAQRLCINLKCHLHEDCEIAVKYSQFTTTLFCCVAMLELWNVAVVLFYMPDCSAKSFLEPFFFVKLEHGNSK